ncbi:MAG: endolytic transglycosylase MltG [Deltaproteobacteria bacterium]|nr:MAG: endolytic transglycosylase MltG [Deltaproteobacteria bacterium]
MKRYSKILLFVLLSALSVLIAHLLPFLLIPPDRKAVAQVIEIPRGMPFNQVANVLFEKEIIKDKPRFHLLAKLLGATTRIQAGEYEFSASMLPSQVLNKLVQGLTKTYTAVIPEGYNIQQIAPLLASLGLINQDTFLAKTRDPALLSDLGIEGESLEGYLFPATYILTRGPSEEEIIRKMVDKFHQVYTPELEQRAKELELSRKNVITMASIIEKETSVIEEMPLISAVFYNRLKKRMRLESDPTVIYGLKNFDGNLRKRDLRAWSPYNTYRNFGLPPGPIANPGKDAIMAALYPAKVPYLYFVSRNNGTHLFSSSYKEHNRAVWEYQKRRRRN